MATNMLDIKLLPFTNEDIAQLVSIEAECFSIPFKEKDFLSILDSEISDALVAKIGDTVVGFVSFTIIIDECQIINFAVSPSFRRMGIADKIMKGLFSHAYPKGVRKYFLEVRESNAPAISLYEKHGFVKVGVSKNHFAQPRENAILMNKELEE